MNRRNRRTAVADSSAPRSGRTTLGPHATIAVAPAGSAGALAVVAGELDLACADQLTAAICRALDEHPAGVRLDMAGVRFFDCAAFHALQRARRHAQRTGRTLTLERSGEAVDLVLGLAGQPRSAARGSTDLQGQRRRRQRIERARRAAGQVASVGDPPGSVVSA